MDRHEPANRTSTKRLLAIAAALLAAIGLATFVRRGDGGDPSPPTAGTARPRPAAAYAPKEKPLRHAPRPVPGPPAAARAPDAGDGGDMGDDGPEGDGSEAETEPEAVVPPPNLREDDPGLAILEPERIFSEGVWEALSYPPESLVPEASRLLASDDSAERALGGVLLFFGQMLEGELLESVVADPNALVPLTVFDWVRDFGTEEQIAAFRKAFAGREMAAEALLAFAAESAGLAGGGRSALDLFLAGFAEDDVPADALARLVASPVASYDVREQALFKLLEPATRPAGEAALRAFADGLAPEDGVLLPFEAGKLAALAEVSNPDGDDEKIWDSEAPVVFFLSQTEGGLQARDLANYLEYALRRDDPEFPPIVELGTWEFANEFLLSARERIGDFPPSELDALDRIASSLDRLVEYDPAFNPFETVEDDGVEDDESAGGDDFVEIGEDEAETIGEDGAEEADSEADDEDPGVSAL